MVLPSPVFPKSLNIYGAKGSVLDGVLYFIYTVQHEIFYIDLVRSHKSNLSITLLFSKNLLYMYIIVFLPYLSSCMRWIYRTSYFIKLFFLKFLILCYVPFSIYSYITIYNGNLIRAEWIRVYILINISKINLI